MKRVGSAGWLVEGPLQRSFEFFFVNVLEWDCLGEDRDAGDGAVRYISEDETIDRSEKCLKRYLGILGVLCNLKNRCNKTVVKIPPRDVQWLTKRAAKDDAAMWILLQLLLYSIPEVKTRRSMVLGQNRCFGAAETNVIRLPNDRDAYAFYRRWFKTAASAPQQLTTNASFIACLRIVIPMAETKKSIRIGQNVLGFDVDILSRVSQAFDWATKTRGCIFSKKTLHILKIVGQSMEQQFAGKFERATDRIIRMVWYNNGKYETRSLAYEFLSICEKNDCVSESNFRALMLTAVSYTIRGIPIEAGGVSKQLAVVLQSIASESE